MLNKLSPVLVRAAGVFIFTLVTISFVTSISYMYMDNMHMDHQSAQRGVRQWQAKINNSVENNHIIAEYETNFLKLVNQGVVGEENRLSWFETIQNTAKKRGMPLVKYGISTQQALKEDNLKYEYGGINVFKSSMTLDVKMAHEGDLFALLNDLAKADGLYTVDKCRIEKVSKKAMDIDNNMKAFCELGWYTFKRTQANKGGNNAG